LKKRAERLKRYFVILPFVFLIHFGCSPGKVKQLALADVKHPAPERDAIKKNNICEITSLDSTALFTQHPELRNAYEALKPKFSNDEFFSNYTNFERYRYDSLGNCTHCYVSRLSRERWYPGTFNFLTTRYNSYCHPVGNYENNKLIDTLLYCLDAERKSVKIYTTQPDVPVDTTNAHDVLIWHLDGLGRVISDSLISSNQLAYSSVYIYKGALLVEIIRKVNPKQDDYSMPPSNVKYYYTGSLLDSVITLSFCDQPKTSNIEKKYYNKLGLLYKGTDRKIVVIQGDTIDNTEVKCYHAIKRK
jgi:hypothetical protein